MRLNLRSNWLSVRHAPPDERPPPRVRPVKPFKAPHKSLGNLDADAAARLIAASADAALVIDTAGVIRDVSFGSDELSKELQARWHGRPWLDTVTDDSRPKIEALLRDAAAGAPVRWRQVNHPTAIGSVPVLYSAVRFGDDGRVVAVGRDLRAMAALQQRLMDVERSMERDYSRLRDAETRYRMLFQLASEAILIADGGSQRIVDANPAAAELLGSSVSKLIGRPLAEQFERKSSAGVEMLLDTVRAAGRADDARLRLATGGAECSVSASLFRQDGASQLLVRLTDIAGGALRAMGPQRGSRLLEAVENSPDGFVVTDPSGRIQSANRAFVDLVQLTNETQAQGESLDRWLGRPGVDLNVLIANLREHSSVRLFATTLRSEYGAKAEVEISAVMVDDSRQPYCGFTIRNIERRLTAATRSSRALPKSVDQVAELVGRVALKDIVRETTDVIERMCIEAALELTKDNRASAAEMLGLSRQSLYVKLRRYGLGDLDAAVD